MVFLMTKMTSTFLLDPRVLDDSVSDSEAEIELEGDAVACFRLGTSKIKNYYAFYVESTDRDRIPSSLLEIYHTKREAPRVLRLDYQKANLLFLPTSFDEAVSDFLKQHKDELLQKCQALYFHGEFKKGDAGTFKNYGVTIL